MDHLLHAFADSTRRQILELLQKAEMSSSEIASHFDMTHSAVSQHLKVLQDARLVRVRKDGTRRLYRICPEGIAELRSLLLYFATLTHDSASEENSAPDS